MRSCRNSMWPWMVLRFSWLARRHSESVSRDTCQERRRRQTRKDWCQTGQRLLGQLPGRVFLFALAALAGLAARAQAPAWTPPVVDGSKWGIAGSDVVLCDPTYKKVYVATRYDWQRKNLLVFDLAADGTLAGEPRRYIDHPDPLPDGQWSAVSALYIDHRHRRIWMGINVSQQTGFTKAMVTYALDANGEPTGTPEAFDNGTQYHSAAAFALHPKLDRLYTAGFGTGAVHAFDLDAGGKPAGAPIIYNVDGIGKYAIAIRPDGSKIYLGSHPGTLAVCDMNAKGEIAGKTRFYAAKDAPAVYLIPAVTARGVYFKGKDDRLWYYRLDAAGEPLPDVVKTDLRVQAVGASGSDRLLVAEPHTFADALTGKPCVDGTRLKEIALGPDGTPGAALRVAKGAFRQETTTVSLLGAPAAVTKPMDAGFLGNRFAGLQLRATLTTLEAEGTLPPGVERVTMHPKPSYLAFVYSGSRDAVYSAFDGGLSWYVRKNRDNGYATLPLPGATQVLALDDAAGRLFVAKSDGTIALLTLGAGGKPQDTGKTVSAGINPISALRVNPRTHQLYVFGAKVPGAVPSPGTEGKVIPVPVDYSLTDADLDPVRGRLYTAARNGAAANIRVHKLLPDGTLASAPAKAYADGIPGAELRGGDTLGAIRVDAKRNRLYAGGSLAASDGRAWIIVYTLDANGDPAGTPRLYQSAHKYGYVGALALTKNGEVLYDGGFGDTSVNGYLLDASGEPKGAGIRWEVTGYGKSCLQASADGKALLIGDYPNVLDTIPLGPRGLVLGGLNATFAVDNGKSVKLGSMVAAMPTPWVNLDELLRDRTGIATGRLTMDGAKITKAVVTLEVGRPGALVVPLARIPTTVLGNQIVLFLPNYGSDSTDDLVAKIQNTEMRFKSYLEIARKVQVSPADRPKQFVVANGLILMDASPAAMEYGMQTEAALGHNTLQIWELLPGPMIRKSALANGITRFRGAIYNPPSYFDYNPDMVTPEYLDNWVAGLVKSAKNMGAKPEEMALYHIGDEPGWYFAGRYKEVMEKPERLAVFRDYLRGKGLTPALLGKAAWDEVVPTGLSTAKDLPSKRLYYWSNRFYPESFSRGFAAATQALQRGFSAKIFTATNLNNWPGHFFIPSPGKLIANNNDNGPDAAYGMPDWFDLGRSKAVSAIWTEDWFGDKDAQNWSLYADLLRCAAREGGVEFGGYPVGHSTGHFEDGGAYKIMALIGHGGKGIDPYIFGPNPAFGDGWSEKPAVYKSLADGIRLLGKSERLTWPGRPRHGTVAILVPYASQLWDPDSEWRYYINELYGLHAALIHRQYPVDFVDETDLEEGALRKYGYAALYLTGANISRKAQAAVLDWVKDGGTLALLPGAAAADELNEPADVLAGAMGTAWDPVARLPFPRPEVLRRQPPVAVAFSDPRAGVAADATALQRAPLALRGAAALATFAGGGVALAEMAQGRGRILSYGYWPGSTYWASPDRSDWYRLPRGWSKSARAAAAFPALLAGAKRVAAADTELVETPLLESDRGIAVTLLNWSGEAKPAVTVTVAVGEKLAAAAKAGTLKVSALRAGPLKYTLAGPDLKVTLPLKTVDVLMIE